MLVGFGQTVCKPIGPRCYECKAKDICPFKDKSKAPGLSKSKSKVVMVEDDEGNVLIEEVKQTE